MPKPSWLAPIAASIGVCLLLATAGYCARVLVVTTEQNTAPPVPSSYSGTYAFTDLVCAGLPFSVATYGRFLTMDMSAYDVIILNGHTSPVPVASVSQKCEELKAAGKKIFVNGNMPLTSYDTAGQSGTQVMYTSALFGALRSGGATVTGSVVMPAALQKEPLITKTGVQNTYLRWWTLPSPAPAEIYVAGKMVGFAGPTGGALCGYCGYEYDLLDYGKLANFIRYGDAMIVGFANDRVNGVPIVAFHTDCHTPSTPSAVNALADISARYDLPLDNTLVLNGVTSFGAQLWNSMTSPLMGVGSHTRSHPNDWNLLPPESLDSETRQAISDQQALIPRTLNFLSFSGSKNPTVAQLDQLTQWGVLFDGQGQGGRSFFKPDGTRWGYQLMPINGSWLKTLACCQNTPTWPSETLLSDNACYDSAVEYDKVMAEEYAANVKYGIYSYGYFHDTFIDPYGWRRVNDISMCTYIDRAMSWFHDQGVHWMFPHDLIARLQDYIAGDITYAANPDGSITITVTRPSALANEIKVGFKGGATPVVEPGPSVLSQKLTEECLYISLVPETTSTVHVSWSLLPPVPPVVTYSGGTYISNPSVVSWVEPVHPGAIAEYQYAVGTTAGGTDAQDWRSTGTATQGDLGQASLTHLAGYYVSVRARYSGSEWSDPGVSALLIADMTPPAAPTVVDDGQQQGSITQIHATWTAADPETGVVEYQYAVGKQPGSSEVKGWTGTTSTDVTVTGICLTKGQTCYVSVKARNGVGLWGPVGSSNGILVAPGVGAARGCPDGTQVDLEDVVVTRVFPGEFYVESRDRCAGMRVVSSESVLEGQVLTLSGTVNHTDTEHYLENVTFSVTGTMSLGPIRMSNRALGGASYGLIKGASEGIGLNNVGLLVTVSGRITAAYSDCIYVDDGSRIHDNGPDQGVQVSLTPPHNLREGAYVIVTGISVLDNSQPLSYRRAVRIRTNSDVLVPVP